MAAPTKNVQVQKVESTQPAVPERTRERAEFTPDVDIIERKDSLYLVADMPGVAEDTIDINVEKNVLTISGRAKLEETTAPYRPFMREYDLGDFRRSFTLSNTIDQTGIEATFKDGVLRLRLPKAKEAAPRKIKVKAV